MTSNPILDELRDTRLKLLAEAGGTIEGLAEALRKRQLESGRNILNTRRTIRCTEAAKSGGLPVDNQSTPPGDR